MLKALGLSLKFTVNLKIHLVHTLLKVYKNKQKCNMINRVIKFINKNYMK